MSDDGGQGSDGAGQPPLEVAPRRRAAGVLLLIAAALVAASLVTRWAAYRADVAAPGSDRAEAWLAVMKLFDVNSEANAPTWFSSSLLLAGALASALIPVLAGRAGGRDAGRWFALAGLLALLSLDEAAAFHERLGGPAADLLGWTGGGGLRFAWVVPGAVLAVVVGGFFVGFLTRLPPGVRGHLIGAGVTFLTASLAVETVGGAVLDAHGDRAGYVLVTAVEEGLEMAAAVWFLYGVTSFLALAPTATTRYEPALAGG